MRALHIALFGLVAVSASSGCKSSSTASAKEDMQLVPKDSQMVLMANLNRMRNTAMWRKMLDLRDSDPKSKADYDEFVQKCSLDPLKQIDSVFLAFPQGAGDAKEFAAILRGTFDEAKLVQCARDQAKKDGADVATSEYGGKKIYTDTKQGQAFAAFLDGKTVAIGGKEWIKKVIDLAAGKKEAGESAKDNAELMALMKRAKTSDAAWGAGLVPQSARDSLKNDPHLSSAASMKDVYGSIDFASGFTADVNVDVGSEADAKDLAAKITSQLADTKKNPQIMMMGVATLIDQVKIEARGATFHVGMSYNQQQVDDIINRVKGFLKSLGGQMGQGLGGGMGGGGLQLPPPQMPQ
ncbi:MAG TPA: hypothetical protein VFF06_11825 [Polyangia bacterium]|nr:hypothetical protein [Polyangia bacterium]